MGAVDFFKSEELHRIFEDGNVVLIGEEVENHREGSLHWHQVKKTGEESFRRLFSLYAFTKIIFISASVHYRKNAEGELSKLMDLLEILRGNPDTELLFIASLEAPGQYSRNAVVLETEERLLREFRKQGGDVSIAHIPYLFLADSAGDYWESCFTALSKGKSWKIPENPASPLHFLTKQDLESFLYRYEVYREKSEEVLELSPYRKGQSFGAFAKALEQQFPGAEVETEEKLAVVSYPEASEKVRKDYGWYATEDILTVLPELVRSFYRMNGADKREQREPILRRLWRRVSAEWLLPVLELLLGAALTEWLVQLSGGSAQFRMIDVRLLFVLIMAGVHGTGIGTAAAVLGICSLLLAYYREGRTALQLFYDPSSWIPFLLLLLVASVLGYTKERQQESMKQLQQEKEQLEKEQENTLALYQESERYKNRYRRNLIESRDGFGRIFEVVERMGHSIPEKIYAEAILAMEDVLATDSVAIYSIHDADARFARLEVCSQRLENLPRSLELSHYREALEEMEQEEIWVNSQLREDMPMYLTGVQSDGSYRLLILIYRPHFEQMSSYYENLIRILRRLMENFLIKAWAYQKARYGDTYIPGTMLVNSDYLAKLYEIQRNMRENHVSDFRVLRLWRGDMSLEELSSRLEKSSRVSDTAGLGEDGNVYVLCSQVSEATEKIVLERFRKLGFQTELVERLPKGQGEPA